MHCQKETFKVRLGVIIPRYSHELPKRAAVVKNGGNPPSVPFCGIRQRSTCDHVVLVLYGPSIYTLVWDVGGGGGRGGSKPNGRVCISEGRSPNTWYRLSEKKTAVHLERSDLSVGLLNVTS